MHPTHHPTPGAHTGPTPAVVLRGAAAYLQAHGWIQGAYYDTTDTPFPAACAVGAIGMAAHGHRTTIPGDFRADTHRDYVRAVDALVDYLDRTVEIPFRFPTEAPDPANLPYEWNDRPSRTAGHVIATLHAAANDYDRTHTPAAGGAR